MKDLSNSSYRKEKLKHLLRVIIQNEKEITSALYADFRKSEFEAVVTETSYVISELKYTISNIDKWSRPKKVFPSLLNFPSSDYILSEPYGKVLIISPWNYPYQLALCPLIAAISAGNKVVLKPSELTQNTSKIIAKIISEVFDKEDVEVIQGDAEVAKQLLSQRWDYIFFTGSVAVGKIVAQAAAVHLTPVTLELGGKSPCIIDKECPIQLTARRIIWGKFINAGQTCIAPDYLLVHSSIKTKLVAALKDELIKAYGEKPEISPDFTRIINEKNWSHLVRMLENEVILTGGSYTKSDCYLAPTLLDEPQLDSLVMKDEIFGPILPIISYQNESELEAIIHRYEKPLSLYVFSNRTKWAKEIMQKYSFGGGCINDTIVHVLNNRMPFGGVGHSGMGAYHGKLSFDAFSHQKSIVKKANWLDLPMRYAPYKNKLSLLKKVLNWL